MVEALLATVIGTDAASRCPSELSEWLTSAACHRRLSIGPAPIAFTVSRLPIVSTSTDCFDRPSRRVRAVSRSSAGLVAQAVSSTTGMMIRRTMTTLPPIAQITATVRIRNGKSTIADKVAEAKKSRSASSSRISPASAPVEPFLWSSRIASSFLNTRSPT